MCAFGIMVSLFERERSGKGQVIDCAMQDGALYLASFILNLKLTPMWDKPRGQNVLDSGSPFYDTYLCKDNQWYSVGAIEPHFWQNFLKLSQLDDAINANDQYNTITWETTRKVVAERFLTKTSAEWQKIFDGTDACAVPVLTLNTILTHPHNIHRRPLLSQYNQSEDITFPKVPAPAPRLSRTPATHIIKPLPLPGQHTEEILLEHGFSKHQITELSKTNIIYCSNLRSSL